MASNSSDVAKSQAEALYKKALELRNNAKSDDSLKEAFKMLIQAADNGYAPAQFTVGELYENMYRDFSTERAKMLYLASAAQDYPQGIAKVLLSRESFPLEIQQQYLKKANTSDHPAILSALAFLYSWGVPQLNITMDNDKSHELTKRAADLGDGNSCLLVAMKIDRPDFLISDPKFKPDETNDAEALEYYKKAAELDVTVAIEILIKKYQQRSAAQPNHILKKVELQELQNKLANLDGKYLRECRLFSEVVYKLGLDKVSEYKPQVLNAYQASSNSKTAADTAASQSAVSNSPEQAQDTKTDKNKPKKTS